MRYPKTHAFLRWLGPIVVVFIGSSIGLVAALATAFPRFNQWVDRQFEAWWPVVSAPWFMAISIVVIAAYIWALIHTGQANLGYADKRRELFHKIADNLGIAQDLALSFPQGAKDQSVIDTHWQRWSAAHEALRVINEQIRYDKGTWATVDDFRHTLGMIISDESEGQRAKELRSDIYQMSGPLFEALHSGKSVNRKKFPLPQWIKDNEKK